MRHVKNEKGDALIEATATLLVFVSIFFGLIEFGRALYAYHFVSEAAREATRWAAVNGGSCSDDSSCDGVAPMTHSGPVGPTDDGTIQTYVRNIAPPGIVRNNVTATASWPGPASTCTGDVANGDGCPVQVTVSYTFHFLVPLIGTNIPMSSTSEMVIAH